MFGPSKEDFFFDHLLWSIFQSSYTYYYKLQSFTCRTSVGSFSCTASTPFNLSILITHVCGPYKQRVYNSFLFRISTLNIYHGPKQDSNHQLQVIRIITQRLYNPSHHGWLTLIQVKP